jgi:peptidoglycan/LPS O-acetylase OafA/YrhL
MSTAPSERRLPPVPLLAIGSMALVLAGGIVMASKLPERPPLAVPGALLSASGALALIALALAGTAAGFDRRTFRRVGGWALVGYAVVAGMLEFVFVRDGTRGSVLLVMTLMLVVFAVDVPVILAFSVARYQEPATA